MREADGYITYRTNLDNSQLQKDLDNAYKDIERIEKQIDTDEKKRLPMADKVVELGVQLDKAKAKLDGLKSSLAYQAGDPGTAKNIAKMQDVVDRLQLKYDAAATKLERADAAAASMRAELAGAKVNAADLEQRLARSQSLQPLNNVLTGAEKKISKFAKRVGTMMRRVFVFSVILRGLREVASWFMNIVKRNDEATAAIAQLKGALLTLAQPLVEVALPAFTRLVNILTQVVTILANASSLLFGKRVSDSAKNAEALYKEGKAIEGVGAAAKKATSYLAGFDEVNKVTDDSASSSSSSIDPDFSMFNSGAMLQSELDKITAILGGALFAVGAVLAFSGANIPLGIGMMALGAAILYKEAKLNWEELPARVREAITGVLVLTGIVCLTVGLLLALTGANIPVGIGLIAIGAAALYAAASLNWDELGDTVGEKLGEIGVIIGISIAVVGVILLLTGHFPLGIGMIIAGVAIFAVSEAALNWDKLGETTKEKLGNLLMIVGGFLAVVGVVLMLTGVAFGWGLAMVIAGVGLFVGGSIAAQWDSVPNTIRDKLYLILRVIGTTLVVLGVILLFTGVGTPLAIGMILAGASALAVGSVAPNWGFLLDKLKGCWADIKQYWNSNIKKYFTIDHWKAKASDIITGLVGGIKGGLGRIKDAFSATVSGAWNKVKNVFSGGSASGVTTYQASTARVYSTDVPALASGAVIPPNREFMAVLGDQTSGRNLEAPEDLIRQIVREESGSSASLAVLLDILEAIRAGSVIMVDKRVLGKVLKEMQANAARTSNIVTI